MSIQNAGSRAKERLALDTNILISLLASPKGSPERLIMIEVLAKARGDYELLICPVVYAEMRAGHARTMMLEMLKRLNIEYEESLPQAVWDDAGEAYGAYAARRRKSGGGLPRRILADFVIGAHAQRSAGHLLTADPQHYRAAFPALHVITP